MEHRAVVVQLLGLHMVALVVDQQLDMVAGLLLDMAAPVDKVVEFQSTLKTSSGSGSKMTEYLVEGHHVAVVHHMLVHSWVLPLEDRLGSD